MEIFGIGPLELLYIFIIALIILGPKDMVKAGRSLGRFLRKIVMSQSWRTVQHASQEFRHLPNKLIREAGLEEFEDEMKEVEKISKSYLDDVKRTEIDFQEFQSDISTWTNPPPSDESPNAPAPKELESPKDKDQKSESPTDSSQSIEE
ncbi:MAG: twin-arginine translocase TatA/TatE family subunit [Anaerolineales bacterium]|nr:twin-arginine translocase TatA/TatE family subunit [Anaerolineales bacterium]